MQIASYWASLGFRIDQKELRKVDSTLKTLEAKLSKFSKKIEKSLLLDIKIDQKKLNSTLGNALDKASNSVVFEISRFSVNQRNMQAALLRASRNSGQGASGSRGAIASDRDAMFKYLQGRANGGGQTAGLGSNTYITNTRSLSPQEWDRREAVKREDWLARRAALREDEARRAAERASRPQRQGNYSYRGSNISNTSSGRYLMGGGAIGGLARYGVAGIPLIGGALGGAALNSANQNLVNANISAESVLGGRSKELLDRLAARSDYMGVNYADTLPQFTKFMASSMPLMGVESSQETFESFMQFGRTRGASKVSMNRALTAVGQMSAKGQVMA